MADKKKPDQPPQEPKAQPEDTKEEPEAKPKAQPEPAFDKAGKCTNYSNPTTCPRTPENPGGHFVQEGDREAHAAAQKARDDAIAAEAEEAVSA